MNTIKEAIYYTFLKACCLYFCMGFCPIIIAADQGNNNLTTTEKTQVIVQKTASIGKKAKVAWQALLESQQKGEAEALKKEFTQDDTKRKDFVEGVQLLTDLFMKYQEYILTYIVDWEAVSVAEVWKNCATAERRVKHIISWLKSKLPIESNVRAECLDLLGQASPIGAFYTLIKEVNIHILFNNLKNLLDDTVQNTVDDLRDFVAKIPTIGSQADFVLHNITDGITQQIALDLLTAYWQEESQYKSKEEAMPVELLSAYKELYNEGLADLPKRKAGDDGNFFYTINNFGDVTQKSLLIYNITGIGNILQGLCNVNAKSEGQLEGVKKNAAHNKKEVTLSETKLKHIGNICREGLKAQGIKLVELPEEYKNLGDEVSSKFDLIKKIHKWVLPLDLRSKVEPAPTILPATDQQQITLSTDQPVTNVTTNTMPSIVAKNESESSIEIDKIDYTVPTIEFHKEFTIPADTKNKINVSPVTGLPQGATVSAGSTTKKSMQDFLNDAFKIEQYFYLPQSEYVQSTVVGTQKKLIEQKIISPDEQKHIKELIYAYHTYKSNSLIKSDFATDDKFGHEKRSEFWKKNGVDNLQLPDIYKQLADISSNDIQFVQQICDHNLSFDLRSTIEATATVSPITGQQVTGSTTEEKPVARTGQPTQLSATSTVMPTPPATTSNPLNITDKPTPSNPSAAIVNKAPAKVTPVAPASSWGSWAYTPVRLLGNAVSSAWSAVKFGFRWVSQMVGFFRIVKGTP